VILGLGVDVLGPRRIVLKGRDRSNAASVCAEAVDSSAEAVDSSPGEMLAKRVTGYVSDVAIFHLLGVDRK
jgi:hypothetical protein